MILKKVPKVVQKKPKLKKVDKPKLKKVVKTTPLMPEKLKPFSENLTCSWNKNFPVKPQVKEYEIITTEEEIENRLNSLSSLGRKRQTKLMIEKNTQTQSSSLNERKLTGLASIISQV